MEENCLVGHVVNSGLSSSKRFTAILVIKFKEDCLALQIASLRQHVWPQDFVFYLNEDISIYCFQPPSLGKCFVLVVFQSIITSGVHLDFSYCAYINTTPNSRVQEVTSVVLCNWSGEPIRFASCRDDVRISKIVHRLYNFLASQIGNWNHHSNYIEIKLL